MKCILAACLHLASRNASGGGCETHGFALLGHSTVGTETSTMYTLPNLLRLGMVFLVLRWRHGR